MRPKSNHFYYIILNFSFYSKIAIENCQFTVNTKPVRARFASGKIRHEFTKSTLNRPTGNLDEIRFSAIVIDCRSVSDGQTSPVTRGVFSSSDPRQFARRWHTFWLLRVTTTDKIAKWTVINFSSLDDVTGTAVEMHRLVVRNLSMCHHHFVVVTKGRVLNVRDLTGN